MNNYILIIYTLKSKFYLFKLVTNMEMQKMQIFKTEIAKKSLFSSSFPREEFLILWQGNAKYTLNLLHLSLFLVNPSPASVCYK